jgi:hypothetical protein
VDIPLRTSYIHYHLLGRGLACIIALFFLPTLEIDV